MQGKMTGPAMKNTLGEISLYGTGVTSLRTGSTRARVNSKLHDKLSYEAWSGINWAITNGVVAATKELWSRHQGHDIGVPCTVRRLLYHESLNSLGIARNIRARVTPGEAADFSRFLTVGYLTGYTWELGGPSITVPDEHGKNQLEGELKRFWAGHYQIHPDPHSVEVDRKVIDEYCNIHRLGDAAKIFAAHLHFT